MFSATNTGPSSKALLMAVISSTGSTSARRYLTSSPSHARVLRRLLRCSRRTIRRSDRRLGPEVARRVAPVLLQRVLVAERLESRGRIVIAHHASAQKLERPAGRQRFHRLRRVLVAFHALVDDVLELAHGLLIFPSQQ